MTTGSGATSGKTILVAEDEYFIARGLVRHLEQAGAAVVGPVPTVAEALAALESSAIDAAVLDINLRGELVYPVADALLARGVPFIFATGYAASALPERYGAVERFEKPVDPEAFVRLFLRPGP